MQVGRLLGRSQVYVQIGRRQMCRQVGRRQICRQVDCQVVHRQMCRQVDRQVGRRQMCRQVGRSLVYVQVGRSQVDVQVGRKVVGRYVCRQIVRQVVPLALRSHLDRRHLLKKNICFVRQVLTLNRKRLATGLKQMLPTQCLHEASCREIGNQVSCVTILGM